MDVYQATANQSQNTDQGAAADISGHKKASRPKTRMTTRGVSKAQKAAEAARNQESQTTQEKAESEVAEEAARLAREQELKLAQDKEAARIAREREKDATRKASVKSTRKTGARQTESVRIMSVEDSDDSDTSVDKNNLDDDAEAAARQQENIEMADFMEEHVSPGINALYRACNIWIRESFTLTQHLGVFEISHLKLLQAENIDKSWKNLSQRKLDPVTISQVQLNLLKTGFKWIRNLLSDGVDGVMLKLKRLDEYVADSISSELLMSLYERSEADENMDEKDDVKVPEHFEPKNWVNWHQNMMNYLMHQRGVSNIPLFYLIRDPEKTPSQEELEKLPVAQRRAYTAAIVPTDESFKKDNLRLYGILKGALIDTQGWAWIKQFDRSQNGRAAMKSLCDFYNGGSERLARIDAARLSIASAHYRGDEKVFDFNKYTTVLMNAFQTLADNGEPCTENKKIGDLLDGIRTDNFDIKAAVANIRSDRPNTFMEACNKISAVVKKPVTDFQTQRRRVSSSHAYPHSNNFNQSFYRGGGRNPGRGGSGRGRSRGRGYRDGGRGKGRGDQRRPPTIVNGVDVSDTTRRYSREEYSRLPPDMKQFINFKRDEDARRINQKRIASARLIAEQISQIVPLNNNVGTATVSAATGIPVTHDDVSTLAMTSATNNIPKNSFPGGYGRNRYTDDRSKRVGKVITSRRNVAVTSKVPLKNTWIVGHQARCEMDTHADTCCLGSNFRVLSYTNMVCDVMPFLDTYSPSRNVPIVTGVTAFDDPETGQSYLLEVNQALYFDNLPHSLLNPNQLRAHGLTVQDNPFDSNGLSISYQDFNLQMDMLGVIVYFNSRVPTDDELLSLPVISLTSDYAWHPESLHISATSGERKSKVNADELSKRWMVSLDQAKDTLKSTTQDMIRQTVHPLTRRFRTDLLSTKYRRLKGQFFSDTAFSRFKSIEGNTCFQVFASEGFVWIYPMKSKGSAGEALQRFNEDVGVPDSITVDGSKEQTCKNSLFQDRCRHLNTKVHLIEPHSPWQNKCEKWIGWLKKKWRSRARRNNVPQRLWDYGLLYEADLFNRVARLSDKRTGYERVTGETPDISEYLEFDFYDIVYFWDKPGDPENPHIGRWIGISHRVGSALCYYVLKSNGWIVSRTTVTRIPREELARDEIRIQVEKYNLELSEKLEDDDFEVEPGLKYVQDEETENWEAFDDEIPKPVIDVADTYDQLIGAEVMLPLSDILCKGTVKRRVRDLDGNLVGTKNSNPFLDTRRYEVEFPSGVTNEYSTNIIVENIFLQYDEDGKQHYIFESIIDHANDGTQVTKGNGTFLATSGQVRKKQTTKGWKFLVEWKDGSSDWIPLSELKESNPVEVAEYVYANNLQDEPAFIWWCPYVRKKSRALVSKVKSRYWKTTHKFGIRLPHSPEEALHLDRENGNTLWFDSIMKEMTNVTVAFRDWNPNITPEDLRKNPQLLPGFQEIKCHMIFDIKMDFTRKARFVAGGHMTLTPDISLVWSTVVSRESIRILFVIAALFDLDIMAADIGNAYLNARCKEKIWCEAGIEFGVGLAGRILIIERALYGLKTSANAWREHFAVSIKSLGFRSCLADPDVYLRPMSKPSGEDYYEYILVYVDDLLCISHDPHPIMTSLNTEYRFKEPASEPTRYLGAIVRKYQLDDGTMTWAWSSEEYVKNACDMVKEYLDKEDMKLWSKGADLPGSTSYRPELDVSENLGEEEIRWYQQLIGMLRWATELGRVDILFEVARLSSFNAFPRRGHLLAVYKIFSYLCKHERSALVFDPRVPNLQADFVKREWSEFYPDIGAEERPENAPLMRGTNIHTSCFVDADHAGNAVTRRSHTGIVIYLQNTPIIWYSKRQNTVESSTFGSELNALRIATDLIEGLRYKLRMFGLRVETPTYVHCDQEGVTRNIQSPQSTLKKKHNSICYHRVREAIAREIILVGWVPSLRNIADLFTKSLTQDRRGYLLSSLIY